MSANPSDANGVNLTPWIPQAGPQFQAIHLDLIPELFYGGAVFGGKSDFLLGDFAQDVMHPKWGKHWHGILFRKTYPQLEQLIARAKEIYPAWFGFPLDGFWSKSEKTWTWPTGATLKMRSLEAEDDWQNYWGHDYAWIGWDELTLWPNLTAYRAMKARLRSAALEIPNKRIRSASNPGGPGHHAVRAYFRIDEYPLGGHVFEPDDGSGMKRVFIRARLQDNVIGVHNDPGYESRLEGVGSPQFVRALKDGDWSVVAGAYFPEFNELKHVIAPFEIPAWWARLRAMDWGSARPFCVLWLAVSDGTLSAFPRGALVVYREWYGTTGEPNVGLQMTAEEVAAGIRPREEGERMADEVLDPSAFARDGGPSIAERMNLPWRRADNARISQKGAMGGWDTLRARLKGEGGGLFIFSTCPHLIRTLPALQHDTHKPEDVDTEGEDHAPDALRYGVMSRPITRNKPDEPPPKWSTDQSIDELIASRRARRLAQE